MAAAVVRAQAGPALLVQGPRCDASLDPPRRHPHHLLPRRQGAEDMLNRQFTFELSNPCRGIWR
jgi:hypothetical protein